MLEHSLSIDSNALVTKPPAAPPAISNTLSLFNHFNNNSHSLPYLKFSGIQKMQLKISSNKTEVQEKDLTRSNNEPKHEEIKVEEQFMRAKSSFLTID